MVTFTIKLFDSNLELITLATVHNIDTVTEAFASALN